MKKIIALLLILLLSMFCFVGSISSSQTLDPHNVPEVIPPDPEPDPST